jgi:hypothetical protein
LSIFSLSHYLSHSFPLAFFLHLSFSLFPSLSIKTIMTKCFSSRWERASVWGGEIM